MRDYVPVFIFAAALIFSAAATLAFVRFGTPALWVTALLEACLAMILLSATGWAQTSESPLVINILMVSVAAGGIAATVQAVGRRRPVISGIRTQRAQRRKVKAQRSGKGSLCVLSR